MNKNIEYVINKVKEYSAIPSLTGMEGKFLDYLKKEIPVNYKYTIDESGLFCAYKEHTPWLILVHTDRIVVPSYRWELDGKNLKGQTDNGISVAVAKYLMEDKFPANFFFTVQEEILNNANQISKVCNGTDYNVLDMDIDVAVTENEIDTGSISLRRCDSMVEYNVELVKKLRDICEKNNVPYSTKEGDWLMCQMSTLLKKNPNIRGCYIGLPIWNYHSNHEIVNIETIGNVIKLFKCIKQEVDNVL